MVQALLYRFYFIGYRIPSNMYEYSYETFTCLFCNLGDFSESIAEKSGVALAQFMAG